MELERLDNMQKTKNNGNGKRKNKHAKSIKKTLKSIELINNTKNINK